jgi:predicted helicase
MNPFDIYLAKIQADLRGGKATEYTYRSSLEQLLETLEKGIDASSDPKHIACGAPDFIVERGQVPLGYVETKDIEDDLDKVEKSEQLKRYRQSLHNLILTNYLELRWYVNGTHKLTAILASIGKDKKLIANPKGIDSAVQLFNEFYRTEVPTVGTPKDLAERMAQLAKLVRNLIINALKVEDEGSENGVLHKQYNIFRQNLLPTIKPDEFADIYAQTMAYGLFAACLSAPENAPFNRAAAYQYLTANRFLRRLFLDVGEELDGTIIAPFLDDIASLLSHADMTAILKDFGKRTRTEDPVVHFYETFLAAYDPKLRESRGVYYTPEPAVKFIVNSIDVLLRKRFNRPMGLADPGVYLLDPASGTGTFLYFVVRVIYDTLLNRKQGGIWQGYVHEKLLPRIFGFELLMAPYVVAHLKLGLLLKDLGYSWGKDDRLHVFLTNTLDEGKTRTETLDTLGWYISEEANEAARVKKQAPIMVVLGNPPYSGHSANLSKTDTGELTFIGKLVRDYYQVDNHPLKERNTKWLQDDYVKFIRFAQWRIQQTGYGILGFITNHSYLDNPTFCGMRQHLINTFNEIYILDLHGNSKKHERTPDGGKDENIFDIQQGVSILLAIKTPQELLDINTNESIPTHVYHADLWGSRSYKYGYLTNNDVESPNWTTLKPSTPNYFLVPQGADKHEEYELCWKVTDVYPLNSLGITTARDEFAVTFDRRTLEKQITEFKNKDITDADLLSNYGLHNTSSWNISKSRARLRSNHHPELVSQYNYRPFDTRWTYHDSAILERDRSDVLDHLHYSGNLALVTLRRPRSQELWNYVFVGEHPIDKSYITSLDNCFVFPLYKYTSPESTAGTLFAQTKTTRMPNISPAFIREISERLALTFIEDGTGDLIKTFGPEDIFHYTYALLNSPTYCKRYAEFLKIDFPRLPLTTDKELFAKLAGYGSSLVRLHLFKSPKLNEFITAFPVMGNNSVEKVSYLENRVWINSEQYFGGIPKNVWMFKIGGYQVCDKWLKDRKGRILSGDDIYHYQQVVVAIHETIRLMADIDNSIAKWPIE